MNNIQRAGMDILVGIILVGIGIIAYIQEKLFMVRVFDMLGYIFVIQSIFNLYQYFIHRKEALQLPSIIITMLIGIGILLYTDIPVYLLVVLFAIYVTFHGVARFLIYWNYKENKVTGRLLILIISIILLVIGLATLISPRMNTNQVIRIVAIYVVLLGMRYIKDGILIIVPESKKDIFRRKIRISLPIFMTALLPKVMMDYVNDKVAVESPTEIKNTNKNINLEIFIHASGKGYGQVGHCDICIDGEIISYGNYDYYSTKLFEMMGEGVLIISKKDIYLPFCIHESDKTIFGYGMHLNPTQLRSVRKAVAAMKANSYQWYPPAYFDSSIKIDYASRLYLETKAKFYKFKKGKFKKYFVLGSNCVLLAENLIGRIGQDIININGIISPGHYQDYLEKEYYKKDSQVVARYIYNKNSLVHK
ncbi:MAG: DUF308 domain-containing protein [Coprobacillaceae bacterium]